MNMHTLFFEKSRRPRAALPLALLLALLAGCDALPIATPRPTPSLQPSAALPPSAAVSPSVENPPGAAGTQQPAASLPQTTLEPGASGTPAATQGAYLPTATPPSSRKAVPEASGGLLAPNLSGDENGIIRGDTAAPELAPRARALPFAEMLPNAIETAPDVPEPSAPAEPIPPADPAAQPVPAPPADANPLQKYIDVAHSTRLSYEELVGDNGDYSEPALPPPNDYWIEIDTTNNVMIVWDNNQKPVRIMLCTTGESDTDTPRGTFKIGSRRERFGFFSEYNCYAQYWTQISGPYYIHSILYSKKSAAALIRSSYRNLGRSTSHGCVRLSVPDARWVYENVAPGTTVTILAKAKDPGLKDVLKLPPQPRK